MIRTSHMPCPRRLFTRRRSRFSSTLLALAAVIVTACAETPPPPPPPNYSDIKVEWTVVSHDIPFDGGATLPATAGLAGLDRFLDDSAVRLSDQIALEPAAGVDPALARARAEALGQHLKRRLPGVRVRVLEPGPDAVNRLFVGRYIAMQPACSGWLTPEQQYTAFRNPDNRADSNFGCASARIFAAQVADPGDLKRGRMLTPAEGATEALAIERYRKGESPHPHAPNNLKCCEVE